MLHISPLLCALGSFTLYFLTFVFLQTRLSFPSLSLILCIAPFIFPDSDALSDCQPGFHFVATVSIEISWLPNDGEKAEARVVMSHMVTCGSISLARGVWGGTGAWLGVLICLIALMCQSIHIGNLQVELSLMRKTQEERRPEVKKQHSTKEEDLSLCLRQKRDLTGARRSRHHGNRSYVHLVPDHFFTNEALDATLIFWKVSMKEGRAFQVQGVNVTVKNSGIYSVYSQVLYNDSRFTMGHLITRKFEGMFGGEAVLLRCVQSMPPNQSMAYNTCYSAGVFRLQKGDSISLVIPRSNANLDARGEATFLGLVKL
ncbi:APRIL isoform X2 [Xenopus laevis]|uniref:APRIL isoform X2 n=2 Tax=Xenopus laevis TaxID=8355 RepID=A0A1L8H3Q9_XENLA|nr:APRIL isoform X2 [Xenopus laevis]OCT90723.1 hypothetical protein XELAEV_18019340mg [Xenopus laevis]